MYFVAYMWETEHQYLQLGKLMAFLVSKNPPKPVFSATKSPLKNPGPMDFRCRRRDGSKAFKRTATTRLMLYRAKGGFLTKKQGFCSSISRSSNQIHDDSAGCYFSTIQHSENFWKQFQRNGTQSW